jgi:hypothetical protein
VRVIAIFILLAYDISATAAESCEGGKHGPLVSSNSTALAPVAFEAIRENMTMWEIVVLLGPAARDIGSGLTILEWNSADGRVFRVGGTSLCRAPLYARFDRGCHLTPRWSGRVKDKVPSSNAGVRAAQLNR